jgi:iron complex outermembrane recepter protein
MISHSRQVRIALCAAVSSLALGTATTTYAQTTPAAPESDEIIVTGFRESLANALNAKKNSTLIIESITAEDIGKFPDQNITESLQRLPGIQIDRENGQGTKVRIRGLDQNVTLLNGESFVTGLEIFKVGEGNFTRDSSLEGVPSDLIGGVDVYKSPNATLLEGGLGGIVDLKTRNPLDLKEGFTVAANARANKGSDISGWEPTGSLVVGYKFNDKLGIIASLSYDKTNDHHDVLGGENRGNWAFANRIDKATVPNYYAPEYRYLTDRDQYRRRWGATLGIVFRPVDQLELSANYFHSSLKVDTREASLKFPFSQGEALGLTGTYSISPNGVLTSGTMRAQSAEAISIADESKIASDNLQFGVKWNNDTNFRASAFATWSKADLNREVGNNDVRYTQYGVRGLTGGSNGVPGVGGPANPAAPATFNFTYQNAPFPVFGIGAGSPADLFSNPANGFFKSHWAFGDRSKVDGNSIRADFAYDAQSGATGTITLSGGFRYGQRNVDFTSGRYLADYSKKCVTGIGGIQQCEVDASAIPAANRDPNYQYNWTPYGYFQDGAIGFKSCELPAINAALRPNGCTSRFGDSPALITPYQTFTNTLARLETVINSHFPGGKILVQNRDQMTDPLKWIQALYPTTPFKFFQDPLQTFRVKEETKTGYIMADMGGKDDPFHVNVGLRIVNTKLSVDQNQGTANPTYFGTDSWNGVLRDFATTTTVRSYTDFLPSINAVANVGDGQKIRFSAARVVARQNLFDLGRGFATDFTRNPVSNLFTFTSGSRGNAALDPYRAYQFDLTYEYYFGRQGLISVGGFWKEVDSFVRTDTVPVFVNDQAGGRVGPVSQPVNGSGGRVRGFEVAAQYAFDFGLGFNANYTFSDTKTDAKNDFNVGLPLPGVSKHSFNGQVYFETGGLSTRLSYSWRSKAYLGNFGFGDGAVTRTLGIYAKSYGQLDGQISYDINKHIGVFVEGMNLTKANQSAYLQFPELPFRFESGSRRVYLGAKVNF